jgi:hypothetical protein
MDMQKTPPRYVPTLTQVVQPEATSSASKNVADSEAAGENQISALPPLVSAETSAQLHQKILSSTQQYLDIELQKRVREAVSQLALEHAYSLFEQIQPLLESTISQVVQEAVDQAVKQNSRHGS